MKIIPIEGNSQKLDGGAMFGNAPKAMWETWVECDPENRINLACRALLYQDKVGKNILFETGVGAFFEPKLKERYGVNESEHILIKNLNKNNIPHEKIDAVVLSHLHFDHAGGLLSAFDDGNLRLLFPNAKYYVGKEQWQRALNPHPRDRASYIPTLHKLLEKSGRLVLVDKDGKCDLNPLVTFRFSYGHTPGLMLAEIHLDNDLLVFASDLIPGIPWMHIPISMGYDRYPELVIDEKKIFLDDLYSKKAKLFFTHDEKHPFGTIKRDEKGKYSAEIFEYN